MVVHGINKPPVCFESQVAEMPKYIFCKLLNFHLKRSNLISSESREVGWGRRHKHRAISVFFFLKDHHLMEPESSGETASFCFILLFKQSPCREADGLSYQGAWANSKAAIANFWKQHFWLSGHLPLAASAFWRRDGHQGSRGCSLLPKTLVYTGNVGCKSSCQGCRLTGTLWNH